MLKPETNIVDFTNFLSLCARTLVECGSSSNRIELVLSNLGRSWGYRVEVAAVPTSVTLVVHGNDERCFDLIRVRSWATELGRLVEVHELVASFQDHRVDPVMATRQLHALMTKRVGYHPFWQLLGSGGASSALIYFFGGPPLEMLLAFPLGFLTVLIARHLVDKEEKRYLVEFISAMASASMAAYLAHMYEGINASRLTVAGLILLVPGLVFVNAVHELAQKNLVSGAARLVEAFFIAAGLSFGAYIGATIIRLGIG